MRGRIIQSVIHFIPCSSYSFHHSLPFFWTILLYPTSTLNPLFSSFFHPAPSPPPGTCAASGEGCRARASVISRGVRRSRAAQSSTGHSMAAVMSGRKKTGAGGLKIHKLQTPKYTSDHSCRKHYNTYRLNIK